MAKAGQIGRCQGLNKLGRHIVVCVTPHSTFLIDYISKRNSLVLERDFAVR